MKIYFSVIRESIIFRPRFSVFSWSVKYAFTFSWFVNQRLFREYFFTFLEILTSLKLVNYTKLDVKHAHSMRLRMENWSRTNHSDSELRGPRICNLGQESWEKFALWAQVRREYNFTCLTSPPPPCPIQWWKLPAISSDFQHCIWGAGKSYLESSACFKPQN